MALTPIERNPKIAEALPQLFMLSGLIFIAGILYSVNGLVLFINFMVHKILGPLGFLGRFVTLAIDDVLQPLSDALGVAEAKIDQQIGASFHKLATAIIGMLQLLIALPVFIYELGQLVGRALHGNAAARASSQSVAAKATAIGAQTAHGIDRVRAADAAALRGIDDVRGRQIAQDATTTRVLEPGIADLRARTKELEAGYARTWDLIRKHEEALGIGAVTGAVAIALERLGGSWIRCRGVGRVGRGLCGLSGPIETLLSDALEALIVTDLCDMVALMADAAKAFEPVLIGFVDVENALIGCHGASLPPVLKVPSLSLPPVTGLVAA